MDMKNLSTIARQLNDEEARIFGKNLGLPNDDVEKYMSMTFGAVWMLRQYRGKRPHFSQKQNIKRALEAIDRPDLVHLIIPPEEEKIITMAPKPVVTDVPEKPREEEDDDTELGHVPSKAPDMDISDVNSNAEEVMEDDEE
jgi:hypothetical protein